MKGTVRDKQNAPSKSVLLMLHRLFKHFAIRRNGYWALAFF